MPIFSNIDDVGKWLKDIVAGIDFAMPAQGTDLAHAIPDVIADSIEKRSEEEQRGATETWPANEPKYKARKERLYGTGKTNFRTKQMLSHKSLVGRLKIEAKSVTMQYGTGEYPTEGANGYIEDADQMVTDIQKAEYAEDGGRKFYDVDQTTSDAVMELVRDALPRYLQQKASE